jgi:hypothetical protein
VAENEMALPFKRPTDSRVSLVTGLNRKEVALLRQRGAGRVTSPPEVEESVATNVLGRWMAGPPYATPDGVPHRLPYEADDSHTASFARLAREVVGVDMAVRSVLDELLHLGIAELLTNGEVELKQEISVPAAGLEGKLELLGSDPGELFRSIVHNIEQPDDAWLQRKVVYDNIGAEALARLKAESRRLGAEFIRRANALLASCDRDGNPRAPGGARTRVVLGVYYLDEPTTPAPESPSGAEGKRPHPPGRIRRSR